MSAPDSSAGPLPGSESVAFCLRLKPGTEAEYRRRHDALWPEMRQALLDAGLLHYEIHLEPGSCLLFAYMVRRSGHTMHTLPDNAAWQRWQQHMADILVQDKGLPLRVALQRMFWMQAEPS
jgi:L-rhamnose mutarotase